MWRQISLLFIGQPLLADVVLVISRLICCRLVILHGFPARLAVTHWLASTGCTLSCRLSTRVLLVGASWPMGSWAGPVGSISR